MGRKHVPMRMCISCRQSFPKRQLIRVVRLADGHVVLDPTGKQSGRGAYLCRKSLCWKSTLTKRSVEHALKTTLADHEWAELVACVGSIEEPDGVRGDTMSA